MCSSKLGSAVKQEEAYLDDQEEDEKPEGLAQPMLDYKQYYPTVLPMRPPGQEACEDEHSKPPDIAHLPVCHTPLSHDCSLPPPHCIILCMRHMLLSGKSSRLQWVVWQRGVFGVSAPARHGG